MAPSIASQEDDWLHAQAKAAGLLTLRPGACRMGIRASALNAVLNMIKP